MIILNALNYIIAGGFMLYVIGCFIKEDLEKADKREKAKNQPRDSKRRFTKKAKKENKDSFTRTYRYHGKVIKKEKVNRGRCK